MNDLNEQFKAEMEELKQEQNEQLKAFNMKVKLSEHLGLTTKNWSAGFVHVSYADCFIEYQAETLNGALTLLEKMDPVSMTKVDDGCCSLKPTDSLKESDKKRTLIGPFVYRLTGLKDRPVEKTLSAYVDILGFRVQIRVSVTADILTDRTFSCPRNHKGQKTGPWETTLKNDSGCFPLRVKWWSTEGQPNDYSLYSL